MSNICILPHVVTTFFDDSAVLLDLQKNTYYALNNSAASFWKFLTENNSFEEVIEKLSRLYGCSPEILTPDIEELICSLIKAGLIERAEVKESLTTMG